MPLTLGLLSEPKPERRPDRLSSGAYGSGAKLAEVLRLVGGWMHAHVTKIGNTYLVLDGDAYALFVTPAGKTYDRELMNSLADFAFYVTDEGHDLRVSQIIDGTDEELAAYFDLEKAFRLSV